MRGVNLHQVALVRGCVCLKRLLLPCLKCNDLYFSFVGFGRRRARAHECQVKEQAGACLLSSALKDPQACECFNWLFKGDSLSTILVETAASLPPCFAQFPSESSWIFLKLLFFRRNLWSQGHTQGHPLLMRA